jgi:hypothetical protein
MTRRTFFQHMAAFTAGALALVAASDQALAFQRDAAAPSRAKRVLMLDPQGDLIKLSIADLNRSDSHVYEWGNIKTGSMAKVLYTIGDVAAHYNVDEVSVRSHGLGDFLFDYLMENSLHDPRASKLFAGRRIILV